MSGRPHGIPGCASSSIVMMSTVPGPTLCVGCVGCVWCRSTLSAVSREAGILILSKADGRDRARFRTGGPMGSRQRDRGPFFPGPFLLNLTHEKGTAQHAGAEQAAVALANSCESVRSVSSWEQNPYTAVDLYPGDLSIPTQVLRTGQASKVQPVHPSSR